MKETFIYELWYYYHNDALKLIAAAILLVVAPIASHLGVYVIAVLFLIFSAFIFLHSLLKLPQVIGMFKGIVFYLLIMGTFIYCFSNVYSEYGIVKENITYHDISSVSYFSVVTWTTLGYGDFHPSESARLWASIEALMGYIFTGILVGLIISAFTPERSRFSPKRPAKKYNE